MVARNGLTRRPPHHQAHHVVPDEVVRKHDLMREAHRRGLFNPDAPENIALLAERRANGVVPDKVPGLSEGLPRHQGSHREYSKAVTNAADTALRELKSTHGPLEQLPDDVIRNAAAEVLDRAWDILRRWKGPHLE
jgi:A nuclease family of the HNH/ENDO VII superfamily with conserved AHH